MLLKKLQPVAWGISQPARGSLAAFSTDANKDMGWVPVEAASGFQQTEGPESCQINRRTECRYQDQRDKQHVLQTSIEEKLRAVAVQEFD